MPANLTPEYFEAEKKFKEAKTKEEKIRALENMLASIPKHKGTEKMQADLKKRIAKLKQTEEKKSTSRKSALYNIEKIGAGQIVLAGAPNTGKSALLKKLTNAETVVAPYPYSTHKPVPGMIRYENIQFQLVDLPPISEEFMEGWVPGAMRLAEIVLLVADLGSEDPLSQIETTIKILKNAKLELVNFETRDDTETGGVVQKQTIFVGTKSDLPGAGDNLEVLKELYSAQYPVVSVSVETDDGIEELKKLIFRKMEIVRVYTKLPGKKPDLNEPYILRTGSTVFDLATAIHKEIAERLKYARIWNTQKYEGQMVNRNYVIQDGDVLEFHA